MSEQNLKKMRLLLKILTVALLTVSFCSYFSFNYFYLFGHIESFSDAIFCLLQWIKLTGLIAIPVAVFLKTSKFDLSIKFFLMPAALFSLFWAGRYLGLEKTLDPANLEQVAFNSLNLFMPKAIIALLFFTESFLMAAIAILFWLRDKHPRFKIIAQSNKINKKQAGKMKDERQESLAKNSVCFSDPTPFDESSRETASSKAHEKKSVRAKNLLYFLPLFFMVMPLNLLDNFVRLFPQGVYAFLKYGNFTVWHFLTIAALFTVTILAFRFLKKKTSAQRYLYLCTLSIAMLVQYMSKASMLIGDGYNVYYSLLAFIPLFICNMGIPVTAVAVFSKNKTLNHLAFFIHAAGALTVFVYSGKDGMSNYGTIFNYTYLYFMFTHSALFILCVLPTSLGEHKFSLKNCGVPLIYYAVFIFVAAAVAQIVTHITAQAFSFALMPNFAFTQNSPITNPFPSLWLSIFGLQFDMLYLPLLFIAHIAIFFVAYALYYLAFGRRYSRLTGRALKNK